MFHHALLHDVNRATLETSIVARPATLHSDAGSNRRVAMGMMRLKIQDAEGHWITANVFVDEGSAHQASWRSPYSYRHRSWGRHQPLPISALVIGLRGNTGFSMVFLTKA